VTPLPITITIAQDFYLAAVGTPAFHREYTTMSKDFAKRNTAPNRRASAPKGKAAPAWLWFVLGAICGAFAMALVFTKWYKPDVKPEAADAEKPTTPTESKTPKPRFDFYKLLQESEVIVPATETATDADKSQERIPSDIEYILQVGSFPNMAEADKLRAQLILLNMDARIESVEIHKGLIWHRVVVGPFDSQEKLANARATLVANQYTALVLKRAKGSKK